MNSVSQPTTIKRTFTVRHGAGLFVLSVALLLCLKPKAQDATPVIEAEKAFAETAVKESMRSAFLKNLDSNGVTFNEGVIYNGLAQFTAAKESSIKLLWHPAYACLSSSGDIGFTTGPFEVRRTMETEVLAAGQYSSIWKKNAEGQWKLLVDLGIDYKTSLYNNATVTASFSGLVPATQNIAGWQQLETGFIKSYEIKKIGAFESLLQDGSWFNLQNQHPHSTKKDIQDALKTVPDNLIFTPVGGGISAAKDLAYAYGLFEKKGKTESYLRVWAHTKTGWMLLLQVIKW